MKSKKYFIILLVSSVILNLVLAILIVNKQNVDITHNKSIIYQAIVLPKNERITLGEEYMAAVYIAAFDTINLPTLVVNDSVEIQNPSLDVLTDTIAINQLYNTFIYSFTPNSIGEHNWGGKLLYRNGNSIDSLYFISTYIVE